MAWKMSMGEASLLLTGLALGYAVLLAVLYVSQSGMLFLPDLPTRRLVGTPASLGLPFEEVHLTTEDGETLHGWYLPKPGADHTLLFCHGNAGNISHRMESLQIFHAMGLSVLIFDYRGYGQSTGTPSEAGTYRDVAAAWHHLVDGRGIAPDRIVLFGRSLGAGIAASLPELGRAAGLILESTFTSVPDLAAQLYPWLPVRWLSRYQYRTLARLPKIVIPVLIIHSRNDEIIPFSHGQRLYEAANAPKSLLELSGDHNGGFLRERSLYTEGLRRFMADLPGSTPGDGKRKSTRDL